jgi:hypothetical protein
MRASHLVLCQPPPSGGSGIAVRSFALAHTIAIGQGPAITSATYNGGVTPVAGDLLIAFVSIRDAGGLGEAGPINTPTNWTARGHIDTSPDNFSLAMFSRIATATSADNITPASSTDADFEDDYDVAVIAVKNTAGVSGTPPTPVNSSTAPSTGSVGDLLIGGWFQYPAGSNTGLPGSMTQIVSDNTDDPQLSVGYELLASPGTRTGTGTYAAVIAAAHL